MRGTIFKLIAVESTLFLEVNCNISEIYSLGRCCYDVSVTDNVFALQYKFKKSRDLQYFDEGYTIIEIIRYLIIFKTFL